VDCGGRDLSAAALPGDEAGTFHGGQMVGDHTRRVEHVSGQLAGGEDGVEPTKDLRPGRADQGVETRGVTGSPIPIPPGHEPCAR
jgi:hypothetical protein